MMLSKSFDLLVWASMLCTVVVADGGIDGGVRIHYRLQIPPIRTTNETRPYVIQQPDPLPGQTEIIDGWKGQQRQSTGVTARNSQGCYDRERTDSALPLPPTQQEEEEQQQQQHLCPQLRISEAITLAIRVAFVLDATGIDLQSMLFVYVSYAMFLMLQPQSCVSSRIRRTGISTSDSILALLLLSNHEGRRVLFRLSIVSLVTYCPSYNDNVTEAMRLGAFLLMFKLWS